MKIGLIDVDGKKWPNLPLMKLSAYHKARGHEVEWWNGFFRYNKVYMSKVFADTDDFIYCIQADEVIRGGTGYGLNNKLPPDAEHAYPDYKLYGITNMAYGFLTRGCLRQCPFCIVSEKEGQVSRKVADLNEFWRGQKGQGMAKAKLSTTWGICSGQFQQHTGRGLISGVYPKRPGV